MATTSKALFRGAATTNTSTTLYTVPSATTTIITNIAVSTASTARTFTLRIAGVTLADSVTIAANSIATFDLKQVITATQTIAGGASSTDVQFHISGVEVA
jgi:ribosomal protein L11